jgi:dTDP-L-rhamnose 4-epimerase
LANRILITGGAGFIGSHLADRLLEQGDHVVALDSLDPQVHGPSADRPTYLNPEVELVHADVRDARALRRALEKVDVVFHFAAAVGVGQSMYEVARYVGVNGLGTAVLLEELARRPIARLVVASSMSIYGEGMYITADGKAIPGEARTLQQLANRDWDPLHHDGTPLRPFPTPETKPPTLTSVYALSKYDQERMCLMMAEAYGIEATALRFFNVYGPRQALSNPYTGVLAIFASRILNGRPPLVYEDGKQRRDFVSVHDVTQACKLALERPEAVGRVFNVGSGVARTIRMVAHDVSEALGRPDIDPEITGRGRVGDVRHCFADITAARRLLCYEPRVNFAAGLLELTEWLSDGGMVAVDQTERATAELTARGLTV